MDFMDYIPSMLHFIASTSSCFLVQGYEKEPAAEPSMGKNLLSLRPVLFMTHFNYLLQWPHVNRRIQQSAGLKMINT